MTDEELAEYYDNHSIMKDYRKAKKNGDVIFCKAGESALEAMRKHRAEKKRLATSTAASTSSAPRRPVAAAAVL